MKKLAIFDLDGTLLNTIADLAGATNYALRECGYPTHDTDAYRYFVGNGINKLLNVPCRKVNAVKPTSRKYVPCLFLIIMYTTLTSAVPIRVSSTCWIRYSKEA